MMKKIALSACSNLLEREEEENIRKLKHVLSSFGMEVIESPCLYAEGSMSIGLGKKKAEILNHFYADDSIDAIFDVSGGDMANEILPYLDYDLIKKSGTSFWGYSDLTTVINAIYTKTGRSSVLFRSKNLILRSAKIQRERFKAYLCGDETLLLPKWQILQGAGEMDALLQKETVIGGNVRCFLKLAGTEYFPDPKGKLLFLESMGGGIPQISTYFATLSQLGIFDEIKGILLGTFSQLEREHGAQCVYEILKPYIREEIFIAKTQEIGHGEDSKAMIIGGSM